MTSNPTIFEKAIAGTSLYDDDIRRPARGPRPRPIFESPRRARTSASAADVFRPVYDAWGGADGFVSIEVQPHARARHPGHDRRGAPPLAACARPNVMVKIPGTAEGVPAIRRCLAEGININITLLFSVARHREVMEAYLAALEERVAAGKPLSASARSRASSYAAWTPTPTRSSTRS